MSKDFFDKHKKDTLSKQDKSSKGHLDRKITLLCKKINKKPNYYTTSSCSGRVVVLLDKEKKEPGVFVFVSHNLISFKELKKELDRIVNSHKSPSTPYSKSVDDKKLSKFSLLTIKSKFSNQLFKFKQEPCILHVACKNLEDALALLRKARLAGWKRSGIIASKKRFICELLSTEKLELPIVEGKILVDDDYLKIIVKKSNENLKKTWLKIQILSELI